MPPKRRTNSNPWENPIDGVYERDVIAQLWQQVETLMEQVEELMTQKWKPNPQEVEEESNHSLFFNDDYVSESVIVDFDKPPIFDEEMSDDDLKSSETVLSGEYSSQGLTSFHHGSVQGRSIIQVAVAAGRTVLAVALAVGGGRPGDYDEAAVEEVSRDASSVVEKSVGSVD
ncbi:hypothetical protein LWI28_027004 [Acer negundo]|uniref:Uncharacterized protein n=1 Tax=Acer negundo TaxID=4023 RepID=A0AAD5INC4_ACENE|nr:hypothetical protein LWI28_027004 [Acer negundo]